MINRRLFTRKLFFIALFFLPSLVLANTGQKKHYSGITAKAAIVIEKRNNRIIYSRNCHLKLPMASTAKVMTALLALENLDAREILKISYRASQIEPSKVYLRPGESWRAINLLHALLMNSANDAAVSIAENVSGSEAKFAGLMNRKAKRLGMKNSDFNNSTGLYTKGQFSTCFDLARLWKRASAYLDFKEIMRTKNKRIISESGRSVYLKNHNRLLWQDADLFTGKTGYTLKAKHCFVGELNTQGRSFIIVILGASKPWQDLHILASICRRAKK